jgi:hypothetical protein
MAQTSGPIKALTTFLYLLLLLVITSQEQASKSFVQIARLQMHGYKERSSRWFTAEDCCEGLQLHLDR